MTDAKATDLATAINKQLNADTAFKGKITAVGDNTTGKVTFTTAATGSDQKITIDASAATTDSDIGFGAGTTAKAVVASGAGSASGTNATRTSLAKQFNTLLDQITQQAKDSSYNGINLLYRSGNDKAENSLKVHVQRVGLVQTETSRAPSSMRRLGLNRITGNFQSDDEINRALTALTSATSQLRAQSSTFGSNLLGGAEPSGLLQEPDQHPRHRLGQLTNADLNEEAATRMPSRPPVDRHLGPVARQHRPAGHPPAPALRATRTAGLRAAVPPVRRPARRKKRPGLIARPFPYSPMDARDRAAVRRCGPPGASPAGRASAASA